MARKLGLPTLQRVLRRERGQEDYMVQFPGSQEIIKTKRTEKGAAYDEAEVKLLQILR